MTPQASIHAYALSLLGLPYIWGGDDPLKGFDCSGLVVELLKAVGLVTRNSDYTAAQLKEMFKNRELAAPRFGALAFYGKDKITHVGFCLDELLMLEAGGGGGSTLSYQDAVNQNAFSRIRPVLSRSDLNGICMPKYPWED